MYRAIVRERERIDRKSGTFVARLAALRAFLDQHGWLDDAERFLGQLDAARARRTKGKSNG
jgi:hypothetical protein